MANPWECPLGNKYFYKAFNEIIAPTGWILAPGANPNYFAYYEPTGMRFEYTGGPVGTDYFYYTNTSIHIDKTQDYSITLELGMFGPNERYAVYVSTSIQDFHIYSSGNAFFFSKFNGVDTGLLLTVLPPGPHTIKWEKVGAVGNVYINNILFASTAVTVSFKTGTSAYVDVRTAPTSTTNTFNTQTVKSLYIVNANLTDNCTGDALTLSAEAMSTTSIELNWNNVAAATGYIIERKKFDGSFVEIATPAAGSALYLDEDCEGSTEYTYRIKYIIPPLESDYSNEATAVTPAPVIGGGVGGGGMEVGDENLPAPATQNQSLADVQSLAAIGIRPVQKSYRYGVNNSHARNWSEIGGANWIFPEVGVKMITVYDDNNRPVNLVMDEGSGLPYYIGSKNNSRSSRMQRVWRDKEVGGYNVGSEIPWIARFKEHTGE